MTLRATRESQLAGAPCTAEDTEEIFWLREADDYASRLALGGALAAQYRYREAIAAYEEAARIRADDAALWLRLGGARLTIRRFDEADAAYTRARALGASDGATAIPLGIRHYLCSDWREAAAAFARGLPAPDETAVAVLYWHTLSCVRAGAAPSLLGQYHASMRVGHHGAYRAALSLFAGETDADEADAALARYTSDLDFVILAYGLAVWRDRRGETARGRALREEILTRQDVWPCVAALAAYGDCLNTSQMD